MRRFTVEGHALELISKPSVLGGLEMTISEPSTGEVFMVERWPKHLSDALDDAALEEMTEGHYLAAVEAKAARQRLREAAAKHRASVEAEGKK